MGSPWLCSELVCLGPLAATTLEAMDWDPTECI